MVDWRNVAAQLDLYVDTIWAEPTELHPMIPGDIDSNPGPDPARSIIKTQAVFMKPGADIVGEAGAARAYGGNVHQIVQDTWISICDAKLVVDLTQWRQHDRVFFPWRDEWWEIAWISPSATMRPDIHLLRVQAADV